VIVDGTASTFDISVRLVVPVDTPGVVMCDPDGTAL